MPKEGLPGGILPILLFVWHWLLPPFHVLLIFSVIPKEGLEGLSCKSFLWYDKHKDSKSCYQCVTRRNESIYLNHSNLTAKWTEGQILLMPYVQRHLSHSYEELSPLQFGHDTLNLFFTWWYYTLHQKKVTFSSSIFPCDPRSGSVTLGHSQIGDAAEESFVKTISQGQWHRGTRANGEIKCNFLLVKSVDLLS